MKSINVLSVFDGMSCGMMALNECKRPVSSYAASETDRRAIAVSEDNFKQIRHVGDIRELKSKDYQGIDLMLGSSPCQDISRLKMDGDGLDGSKSALFWHQARLLNEIKPKYFLFENVVPRKKEWLQQMNDALGVDGVMINSDRFVQQNRPRYYWTNIPIAPLPQRPEWEGEYWQFRRTYFRKNKNGVCPCLTANMGTGGHNVPLKSENKADKLSIREVMDLQGIPNYIKMEGMASCHLYKILGNGWTVPVISHILNGMDL